MAYLRKPEDRKRGEMKVTGANVDKLAKVKYVAKSKLPAVPVGEPAVPVGEDEASMHRHQRRFVYSCIMFIKFYVMR